MKNIFFLHCCIIFIPSSFAQSTQLRIDHYAIPQGNGAEKVVVLKMPYANYNIEAFIGDTAALRNAGEIIIDVVCTDYPTEQSLATLNANRVKEFFKTFSYIHSSQVNHINYYRQKRGDEKQTAIPLFHGVVVRWRPAQDLTTMKNDWNKLEELLSGREKVKSSLREEDVAATTYSRTGEKPAVEPVSGKPLYYDPSMSLKGKKITHIIGDADFLNSKFRMPENVPIFDFKKAWKKDLVTKRVYQQFKDKPYSYITLYVPLAEENEGEKNEIKKIYPLPAPPPKLADSTIIKVLKRNNWKHAVVIADVTGSMYPYTAQLLLWLSLHANDSLSDQFVFFNDGDEKDDDEKKIGKTGGIYFKECKSYEEVKELAKMTMMKGGGGDFPENCIEALLLAQKSFSETDSLIMIADNWAPIRDKELINQLTKPVKVILCGVTNGNINADYLNLARKTNGSLHLIENDILNLAGLHENEEITVGNKKFKVQGGELKEMDIAKEK